MTPGPRRLPVARAPGLEIRPVFRPSGIRLYTFVVSSCRVVERIGRAASTCGFLASWADTGSSRASAAHSIQVVVELVVFLLLCRTRHGGRAETRSTPPIFTSFTLCVIESSSCRVVTGCLIRATTRRATSPPSPHGAGPRPAPIVAGLIRAPDSCLCLRCAPAEWQKRNNPALLRTVPLRSAGTCEARVSALPPCLVRQSSNSRQAQRLPERNGLRKLSADHLHLRDGSGRDGDADADAPQGRVCRG